MDNTQGNINHVEVYQQNIDNVTFDALRIADLELPALFMKPKCDVLKLSPAPFKALKNLFELKSGKYPIYMDFGNVIQCLGRMDYNIDNMYVLFSLFSEIDFVLVESEGSQTKLSVEDMLGSVSIK